MASASGYQMVVSVGEAKQIKDMAITSLQVLLISAFLMLYCCMCQHGLKKYTSPHIKFLSGHVGMHHP